VGDFIVSDYVQFIERKTQLGSMDGFEPLWMPSFLFDFQQPLVEWALRKGRALLAQDCGLGKTPQSLVWGENVVRKTNKPVLYLTPLAVSFQTIQEAEKFGIEAHRSKDGTVYPGINVTNYERLHYFNPHDFAGVICGESSILKNFDGAYKSEITEFMRKLRYRLCETATAAPNDYIELGTTSEALGELGYMDMLSRFFKNDSNNSIKPNVYLNRGQNFAQLEDAAKWRLKGHAEIPFWRWVCSWARAVRKPSDLGFDDGKFILPPLVEREHLVTAQTLAPGMLFPLPAVGLKEQREERRRTVQERCEKVAELVRDTGQPALVWCHLNDEGDLLERLIPDAIQVSGKDSDDAKEEKLIAFANGKERVMVTKPKIEAWGLNLQRCAHVTFFPSHSYEQHYQGVRRCYRFGQTRPVVVDIVTTEGEQSVLKNLQRKAAQADKMFTAMIKHMHDAMSMACIDQKITNAYAIYNGDCVETLAELPDESIALSIYSPPFATSGGGLFTYSSSERDLSNCSSYEGFFSHYEFVIRQIRRVTMPGRMTAVHCMDVPSGNCGKDHLIDFPGDIIRLHEKHGFRYIARYAIWKEPLAVRNRTMAKNLAHKTIVEDSSRCSVASADYLLVFRRDGENKIPIAHPTGLEYYAGERQMPSELLQYKNWKGNQIENRYSHWIWRQYASAFWDDIRLGRVLPFKGARDSEDEKHVHPLQLDVIDRVLVLWSNPGETVLSPFMGVGSEIYGAVCAGRRGIGIELKPSYYRQAEKNLAAAEVGKRDGENHSLEFEDAEPPLAASA
jgi:DNA modification methylase